MVLIHKSVVAVLVRVVGVPLLVILLNIFLSSALMRSYRIRFLLGDGEGLACGILAPAMLIIPLPFQDHLSIECAVRIGVSLLEGRQSTKIYIELCHLALVYPYPASSIFACIWVAVGIWQLWYYLRHIYWLVCNFAEQPSEIREDLLKGWC